jgi:hypothetical protein
VGTSLRAVVVALSPLVAGAALVPLVAAAERLTTRPRARVVDVVDTGDMSARTPRAGIARALSARACALKFPIEIADAEARANDDDV